jgi:hypothetical protein
MLKRKMAELEKVFYRIREGWGWGGGVKEITRTVSTVKYDVENNQKI